VRTGSAGCVGTIEITYIAELDDDLRERALVDLVRLAVAFEGLRSESFGAVRTDRVEEFTARRSEIHSQL
jgi:hypothetical protein